MALSVVNTTTFAGASVISDTFSHDSGSGDRRHLVVRIHLYDQSALQTITSVTYNGVALSMKVAADHVYAGTRVVRISYWELADPTPGANDIVVTASGTCERLYASVSTYSDCGGLGANSASTQGNLASFALPVTTGAATSRLEGCWAGQASRVVTPGTGNTVISTMTGGSDSEFWVGWEPATAGADTWDITLNIAVRSVAVAIEVLEDLGGGGGATVTGQALLSGYGSLASLALNLSPGEAPLQGQGQSIAAGLARATGASNFDAQAELVAQALHYIQGAAAMDGMGASWAQGQSLISSSGAMDGSGALAADSLIVAPGQATGQSLLQGLGALVANANNRSIGAAAMDGMGASWAQGQSLISSSGAMDGLGRLVGTGTTITAGVITGAALLDGQGRLVALPGALVIGAQGAMEGLGFVQGSGVAIQATTAHILGAGRLLGQGGTTAIGAGLIEGHGRLVALPGSLIIDASGAMEGHGRLVGQSYLLTEGAALLQALGSLVASGRIPAPYIDTPEGRTYVIPAGLGAFIVLAVAPITYEVGAADVTDTPN